MFAQQLGGRSLRRSIGGCGAPHAQSAQRTSTAARTLTSVPTVMAPAWGASSPAAAAATQARAPKESGTIASVFATLSGGSLSDSLPPRFLELKQSIVRDETHARALQQAWTEVLTALQKETGEVSARGESLIPQVTYPGDAATDENKVHEWMDASSLDALRKRGTVILKNVVAPEQALSWKNDIRQYINNNPHTKGFPEHDPQVFELYWSKAQLAARGHPSLLRASRAVLSLWRAPAQESRAPLPPDRAVSLRNPLSYCDRLRIRAPGDAAFALGPHIDGGGVERWEDPTFRGCWSSILGPSSHAGGTTSGFGASTSSIGWQAHDSWSLGPNGERLGAQSDMYNGAGACSVFRPLQGWLSMSSTGAQEGTLRVLPLDLTMATAYIVLRPFFRACRPREAFPTEEAYLAADNWALDLSDPHFDGCSLGRNIELSTDTHPHLRLDATMTSIPHVEPGDVAFWHCDVVHAVEAQHAGQPGHDSSVMYIPAIPLTQANFRYVEEQRTAFLSGTPPHDFPGGEGESRHLGHGTDADLKHPMARRAMGLERFAVPAHTGVAAADSAMPAAERQLLEACNARISAPPCRA